MKITIRPEKWEKVEGISQIIPVKVGWPELQLTHDQIYENALAALDGLERPHEDRSIIEVVVERPRA